MKIEINITKRKFWVLVAMFLLVVGIFVFADKPIPVGHSIDEIEGLNDLMNTVDNHVKAIEACSWENQMNDMGDPSSEKETKCDQGKYLAGIKFRNGDEADELDMWSLYCCSLS